MAPVLIPVLTLVLTPVLIAVSRIICRSISLEPCAIKVDTVPTTPDQPASGASAHATINPETSPEKGPVQTVIEDKLAAHFDLQHLQVDNESGSHNVPAGSESHFKLVLVGESFADMSRVARHRAVHEVLSEELAGPVHALAIHLYSPEQWRERFGDAPLSPPCLGGDGSLESA